MNHTASQGSILGTDFPVGDIGVKACEGLVKGVLEAFSCPSTERLPRHIQGSFFYGKTSWFLPTQNKHDPMIWGEKIN